MAVPVLFIVSSGVCSRESKKELIMLKKCLPAAAAILFAGALALSAEEKPNSFDGTWDVVLTCPAVTEPYPVPGFTYKFVAGVKDSELVGLYGVENEPNSLKITGKIKPNGKANLHAAGRIGNPDKALGHAQRGTPYSYDFKAQFEGSKGTGERLVQRKCDFVFTRQ
jgi:hypothetical protein